MHTGSGTSRAAWLARRLFPLLATVIMAAAGMAGTIWGPRYYGKTAWALPDDLWGTLIAAQRFLHLQLSGLYTSPTQLVSLPGAAGVPAPPGAAPRPLRRRGGGAGPAGGLGGPGRPPRRHAAGHRGRGQLDRHRSRGHQPAELPGHRPPHPMGLPRPARGRRAGGGRARPDPGRRGGLRMRAGRRAPLAGAADLRSVGPAGPAGAALVDPGDAGPPVGVRARGGVVLPMSPPGGGRHRRRSALVAPAPARHRPRGAPVL